LVPGPAAAPEVLRVAFLGADAPDARFEDKCREGIGQHDRGLAYFAVREPKFRVDSDSGSAQRDRETGNLGRDDATDSFGLSGPRRVRRDQQVNRGDPSIVDASFPPIARDLLVTARLDRENKRRLLKKVWRYAEVGVAGCSQIRGLRTRRRTR
jgi:hypothetical protein